MSNNMQRYPKYKDSGLEWLGNIPKQWRINRVGYCFNERREKVSDRIYKPLSVTKKGVVPQLDNAAKTTDGDNRKKVCEGDFVINSRSDRKGSSGLSSLRGSVSLINTVITPININSNYAHWLLKSRWFQEEFYRHGKGIVADLWSTKYSEMRNMLVPLPSDTEQKHIANYLDIQTKKIDNLIKCYEKLITLSQEKRTALITHCVTQGLDTSVKMKSKHARPSGEWTKSHIKYCCVINPKKSEISLPSNLYCSFLPMEKIKNDSIILDESKTISEVISGYNYFRENDIIMAKVTPCFENRNIAIVKNLVNGIGFGTSEIYTFRANYNTNNRFLFYRLQDLEFLFRATAEMTGAGGLKRVPQEYIANYVILLPQLNEQKAIVNYLNQKTLKIDQTIEKAKHAIELMKEKRSALITAVVTGKVDVREYQL